mmetsp:Transcript_52460/g.131855  ORF Transcript_52460/g.131855 Transcript_52460/m.131855 type:complete len:97 (+) Transcript_52460:698-988(+)
MPSFITITAIPPVTAPIPIILTSWPTVAPETTTSSVISAADTTTATSPAVIPPSVIVSYAGTSTVVVSQAGASSTLAVLCWRQHTLPRVLIWPANC